MQSDSTAEPVQRELFIYYRAAVADAAALQPAVSRLQADLRRAHPGLETRLLYRPPENDGPMTWMEAYALPPGADPSAIASAVENAARVLDGLIVGPRHAEHFVACAS